MLLDERGLAGGSASLGRASLPGQFGGPELRYLRRGVHLPRWRRPPKACSSDRRKGAGPVEAQALGGRHYRGNSVDQNFDTYAVEYTFPDGDALPRLAL